MGGNDQAIMFANPGAIDMENNQSHLSMAADDQMK
jgi:hypothetical protein